MLSLSLSFPLVVYTKCPFFFHTFSDCPLLRVRPIFESSALILQYQTQFSNAFDMQNRSISRHIPNIDSTHALRPENCIQNAPVRSHIYAVPIRRRPPKLHGRGSHQRTRIQTQRPCYRSHRALAGSTKLITPACPPTYAKPAASITKSSLGRFEANNSA
jgi:hypothetical protein